MVGLGRNEKIASEGRMEEIGKSCKTHPIAMGLSLIARADAKLQTTF